MILSQSAVSACCHSLALVVKHSFDTHIPHSIAFLLHRVPAHFSKSALRREEFKELQKVMDEGERTHPFDKLENLYLLMEQYQGLKSAIIF